ncbi:MAG: SPOR domain-containing protein [Luteimonas sp.]|nr:SPOR domain-containing protein [Luteimonas sp.]
MIFLPMLVKGPAPDSGVSHLPMRVPDAPDGDYKTVDLPLVVPPGAAPEGGVLGVPEPGEGDALPTVDTATAPPAAQPQPSAATAPTGEGATPPPARSEPMLPATAAGGDYAVHFGSFSSERDAQLIVRQLDAAGLTAYSEAYTLNGKPAQRVRLGPYASRAEAETVRVRAAQVRNDVSPRVVALDAPQAPAATAPAATTAAVSAPAPKPAATPARPAEVPKPAAPTPAATADVGFAVQVGAFGNAAEAAKLRDRLRGLGIAAFTDTVATDKGRLTRVKAGPVSSRADADRLKAQVKAKAGLDGIVRPHP